MEIPNLFKFPNPDQSLSIDEIVEQNLDFYHDNMRRVSAEYGGSLVVEKDLAGMLRGAIERFKIRYGRYPNRLTPPKYPLEEFIPIQVSFEVVIAPGIGLNAKKWYFVRRPRSIRGPDRQATHTISVDASSAIP